MHLRNSRRSYIALLILLCGDVESCPGPISAQISSERIIDKLMSLLVGMSVRIGSEVISIQDGGGMLTSSIRRAHGVRTKVGRLRKHSVLKSDWFSTILTCRKNKY